MLLFYGNYNKLIEQKFASSSTPFAFVWSEEIGKKSKKSYVVKYEDNTKIRGRNPFEVLELVQLLLLLSL